jgi:hypothetical protein
VKEREREREGGGGREREGGRERGGGRDLTNLWLFVLIKALVVQLNGVSVYQSCPAALCRLDDVASAQNDDTPPQIPSLTPE